MAPSGTRFWLYLFAGMLVLQLAAIGFGTGFLRLLSKPMLVPLLAGYVLSGSTKSGSRNLLLAALGASWAGDLLLQYEHQFPGAFIAGLASFLTAHVFYILLFLRLDKTSGRQKPWNRWLLLLLAFYVFFLCRLLYPGLGALKIPVTLYALVISLMLLSAMKAGSGSAWAGRSLVGGAALFVLSDSILAIDRFLYPIAGAGIWIMLSYGLAQFFIVIGAVNRLPSVRNL